ncbi:MAG: hypothetical protein WKH64_02965 [Chloroflexia bacterium]
MVYAVPGSPTAGERSVVLLRAMCAEAGVELVVLPAVSSVEATLVEIGVDVLADGLQIVDASELSHLHDVRPSVASQFLNPTQPLLLSGVWQHSIASAVKLFLLANYPPEHGVRLVRAGSASHRSRSRWRTWTGASVWIISQCYTCRRFRRTHRAHRSTNSPT